MYWDEWEKMIGGAVEGMEQWITQLKLEGYRIYGLSNWSTETFPLVKDKYKVFSMMDGIVMSGEEKIGKPDVRLYQILLDRYELKAEECVFLMFSDILLHLTHDYADRKHPRMHCPRDRT